MQSKDNPWYGKRSPFWTFPNQCVCDLCGLVFLWRNSVKEFELLSGGVEDPFNYDLLCASRDPTLGRLNVLKAGKSRVRCNLCWEAICRHCSVRIPLRLVFYAEKCFHCEEDLLLVWRRTVESQRGERSAMRVVHLGLFCQCCGWWADSGRLETNVMSVLVYVQNSGDSAEPSLEQYRLFGRPGILCGDCKKGLGKVSRQPSPYVSDCEPVIMTKNHYNYPKDRTSRFVHYVRNWPYTDDRGYWQCRCRGLLSERE